MKLRDLQSTFAEALVIPNSITHEAAWTARGKKEFTGSTRLSPIEQLDVYREQFWLRHVACLEEDFPVLLAVVGKEAFAKIVADYIRAFPPVDFQLRHFGKHLAEFLAREDRALSDVARLEWAFIDAFDAADAPPLDPNVVGAIAEDAWPSARLVLHPSLQRMELLHSAHTLREAWRAATTDETKSRSAWTRPEKAPACVVVYRMKFLLYAEEMDPLAYAMLERIARGEALGAAGDALAAETGRGEEIEARIGEWFTRWSALGWISSVIVQ